MRLSRPFERPGDDLQIFDPQASSIAGTMRSCTREKYDKRSAAGRISAFRFLCNCLLQGKKHECARSETQGPSLPFGSLEPPEPNTLAVVRDGSGVGVRSHADPGSHRGGNHLSGTVRPFPCLTDEQECFGGLSPLMTELFDAMDFLERTRRRLRFGKLSREPLRLLRLEWKEIIVECDWLMRPPDPWDKFLPAGIADKQVSIQALRDALLLREMVFKAFPRTQHAELRMFRRRQDGSSEVLLTGSVSRSDQVLQRVPSVAMRARMCGFQFSMTQGVLESSQSASLGCV